MFTKIAGNCPTGGRMGLYTLLTDTPNTAIPADPTVGQMALILLGVFLSIIIGYFLGSINTAIIYSTLRYKKDIRDFGSGNAGMTNMLRTFGKGAAAITLAGDMLKSVAAVLIVQFLAYGLRLLSPQIGQEFSVLCAYTAALFAAVGHCFPIYYKFRGGKGVATCAAAIAVLSPFAFLCCLAVFLVLVFGTKYVSLASIISAMTYPLFLNRIYGPGISNIFAMLMAALIVWQHRENLKRLWRGEERKISIGKPKNGEDDGKGRK